MANITKKLATSNTFIAFDHRLGDWVGVELFDPTKKRYLWVMRLFKIQFKMEMEMFQ